MCDSIPPLGLVSLWMIFVEAEAEKNQPMIGKSWENHCAASCTFAAVLTSRIPERLNRKEHGKSHGSTTVHKVPTANKHQKKTSCVYKSVRIRILYVYNRSDLETSPLAPIAVTKGCLRLSKGPG